MAVLTHEELITRLTQVLTILGTTSHDTEVIFQLRDSQGHWHTDLIIEGLGFDGIGYDGGKILISLEE